MQTVFTFRETCTLFFDFPIVLARVLVLCNLNQKSKAICKGKYPVVLEFYYST